MLENVKLYEWAANILDVFIGLVFKFDRGLQHANDVIFLTNCTAFLNIIIYWSAVSLE